jgi:hypothetical protein
MEAEVNALMSATDETHWRSTGLFNTVDALSSHHFHQTLHSAPPPNPPYQFTQTPPAPTPPTPTPQTT